MKIEPAQNNISSPDLIVPIWKPHGSLLTLLSPCPAAVWHQAGPHWPTFLWFFHTEALLLFSCLPPGHTAAPTFVQPGQAQIEKSRVRKKMKKICRPEECFPSENLPCPSWTAGTFSTWISKAREDFLKVFSPCLWLQHPGDTTWPSVALTMSSGSSAPESQIGKLSARVDTSNLLNSCTNIYGTIYSRSGRQRDSKPADLWYGIYW